MNKFKILTTVDHAQYVQWPADCIFSGCGTTLFDAIDDLASQIANMDEQSANFSEQQHMLDLAEQELALCQRSANAIIQFNFCIELGLNGSVNLLSTEINTHSFNKNGTTDYEFTADDQLWVNTISSVDSTDFDDDRLDPYRKAIVELINDEVHNSEHYIYAFLVY